MSTVTNRIGSRRRKAGSAPTSTQAARPQRRLTQHLTAIAPTVVAAITAANDTRVPF